MKQSDVVNYLININDELIKTYDIYQNILYALKHNNYNQLKISFTIPIQDISVYENVYKKYLLHMKRADA